MNHLVRAQGSRGCVNACRCVLGVLARIACVSVRVHTHRVVEAMGGNGGGGRRGKEKPISQTQNSALTGAPAAHSSWTRGAGSQGGTQRREMTRSEFCLDERKFFAQGNSPPGVCPPLWRDWDSGEPSGLLQTQFELEINVGWVSFFFFLFAFLTPRDAKPLQQVIMMLSNQDFRLLSCD